jgi:hypothetical protein
MGSDNQTSHQKEMNGRCTWELEPDCICDVYIYAYCSMPRSQKAQSFSAELVLISIALNTGVKTPRNINCLS